MPDSATLHWHTCTTDTNIEPQQKSLRRHAHYLSRSWAAAQQITCELKLNAPVRRRVRHVITGSIKFHNKCSMLNSSPVERINRFANQVLHSTVSMHMQLILEVVLAQKATCHTVHGQLPQTTTLTPTLNHRKASLRVLNSVSHGTGQQPNKLRVSSN
jgi:hypothetical protein